MILTPSTVPMLGRVWRGWSYDSDPEYSTNDGGFGKVGPMILTPSIIVPMFGRVWQGWSYDSNPEYSIR